MSNPAHTYNPANSNFHERIRSYKAVLASYRSIEASLEQYERHKDWKERLGSSEELSEAQIIISNSLDMAAKSVTASEIRKAEAQGLLDLEDMKLIARLEREQEMQARRKAKQEQQDSQSNRFKQ